MTMTSSIAFRTGIALAATALAAHSAAAQAEHRTLAGSSIAIYDLAGRVQVEQGSGSDVVVEITRGGHDAKKLTIDVGELRGRNTLRVRFPDDDIVYPDLGRWSSSDFRINSDGTWGGNDGDDRDDRGWGGHRIRIKGDGRGTEAWADLRILVPSGKDVAVYIGVGELGATHVSADLRLSASSGRVTVKDTKGNLVAATGSGGVDVRGANGDDVRISAGSGSVTANDVGGKRLRVSTGSGGVTGSGLSSDDLDVSAGSGSIRVDDARAPRVRLSSGSGGIRVGFASPVKSLDASTGSGDVTVTLPGAVNAQVDVSTGSGGIDSDFPVQLNRMERNRLRGQIGDGSGTIRIRSGSGSVHLRKL
jgi:lia operon protein LiaG